MTIGERIKILRKEKCLSMEDFGAIIGMGKSAVSRIENGVNGTTDQTIRSICREFGVNEQWLRTGEGEMFEQTRASVLDRLSTEYDLSREQRSVIEAFLDLDPQERDVILKYVHNVFDRSAESAAKSTAIPDKEAQRIAESDEFKTLREKNEPPESESCTTAG
jgi:transcriptional regulator with XRE-family HTH domain|nr:MAG TPA: helix-turn-helix domain protein [Caudoviricetes sp.]